MAQTIALANDATTLVLNGEIIGDLVEDDSVTITWPNPKTSRTNASGNGVTVANNTVGNVCQLQVTVQKHSTSDVLLNSWLNGGGDFPKIINGSARTLLQREGVEVIETYTLEGGTFTDRPEDAKNNTEPDGAIQYTIEFRNGQRSM